MARELAGSSRTFLCSDKNGEFSVTGEFQNPSYEFVNREKDQDKSSFFGIQCTDEAADKRIKETPKQNNKQVEMAGTLSNLRPLGLKLSVTPSLLDLAEKKLNRCKYAVKGYNQPKVDDLGPSEMLKAANFSAKLLKIGNWKIVSYYEDHLVAKCYYTRRMLLWEILESGLKNKIEIHWNDIIAMRAIIQENQPGILELELNRVPKLYVEKDPQARKHSDWKKAADDFTGGQVSTYRRHYLQFPPGSFDKHYEKLLKCDQRLYDLCHKPFPSLQSPYFEPIICGFSDSCFDYHRDHRPDINLGLPFEFSVIPSPLVATQTSFRGTPSPISVMDFSHPDEQNNNKIVFERARMTLSSPTIQFSHQAMNPAISYQNELVTSIGYQSFSDRQVESCYDEQYHMARVESLTELVNLPKQLQEEDNLASENGSQKAFYEREMGINEQFQVQQQQQVSWNNLPRMENFGPIKYQQPYL